MAERADPKDLLRDNVLRLIPLLAAAVIAPVVTILAGLPVWVRVGAAAASLVAVVLAAVWLPLPWSAWRADHGRKLLFVSLPLVVAAGLVATGFAVRAPRSDPQARAMLVLLDGSQAMANGLGAGDSPVCGMVASVGTGPPGQRTKLDVATACVKQHVSDNQFEQVGLATFGGTSCASEDEPLHKHVGIAFERKAAIEDKLAGLEPSGDRELVAAASNALSLLNPFKDATGRRLVIITGGLDGCGRRLDELIVNARGSETDFTWDFVGLQLSEQEKQQAGRLQGAGVTVHLADTPSELDEALKSVLREEPIREGIDDIRNFVTRDVRDPLQEADDALNRGDLKTVEKKLDTVNGLVGSAEDRFLKIDTTEEGRVFKPMVVLLDQMIKLQRRDLDLLDQRLKIAQGAGVDKLKGEDLQNWNRLTEDNQKVVNEYNNVKVPELERVLEKILEELFGK
jgi:hypothetical protein